MLIGNNRYFLLLAALLIAAVIPSCKSPTAPLAGPKLTLILPDSARAFDSVTLRAHYSDPVQSSWKFSWQFGDSARATTKDTSITHVYDSAGTYLVQVTLEDSSNKSIAHQSGQLQVMPLNTPTLTLTVPDSVFWGDSCVISVSSSQPLKQSWKYTWSFGDSTTFSSQQDSVMHWYLNPGTYTVRVELDDTARHIPLGSRTAKVKVVARHFDLALLQSMKYVDFSWQGHADTSYSQYFYTANPCGEPPTILPLSWNGTNFSMGSNYSTSHNSSQAPGYGEWDAESGNDTMSGMVDINSSEIITFSRNIYYTMHELDTEGGQIAGGCWTTSSTTFSAPSVPFVNASDSDVVFEANGDLIKNASYGWDFQPWGRFTGAQFFNVTANFADTTVRRYVIIRFHK